MTALIYILDEINNLNCSLDMKYDFMYHEFEQKRQRNKLLNLAIIKKISLVDILNDEFGSFIQRILLSLIPCRGSKKTNQRSNLIDIVGEPIFLFSNFKFLSSPLFSATLGLGAGLLGSEIFYFKDNTNYLLLSVGCTILSGFPANFLMNLDLGKIYNNTKKTQDFLERIYY